MIHDAAHSVGHSRDQGTRSRGGPAHLNSDFLHSISPRFAAVPDATFVC
jgi:hypothetical protein